MLANRVTLLVCATLLILGVPAASLTVPPAPAHAVVGTTAPQLHAGPSISRHFGATHAPTITGTITVGSTVKSVTRTWVPRPNSITYQWKRNGKSIPGATRKTYTLTAADAGASITVTVRAGAPGRIAASRTSKARTVPRRAFTATAQPSMSGSRTVGSKLTASAGSWRPSITSVKYQWLRNGVRIPRATGRSYTLTPADAGTRVSVTVTGSRPGFAPRARTRSTLIPAPIASVTPPTISGTAAAGESLSAQPGSWSPASVSLQYSWLRNGTPIPGATRSTYTLSQADVGQSVSVAVTATRIAHSSARRVSASVTIAPASEPADPSDESLPADAWLYLRGVNTQGGESTHHDPTRVPGVAEYDYHWNSAAFYEYLASRGHKVVRIPFLWERVQHGFGEELDPTGLAELQMVVDRAADAGLLVLLDMHNYGRYWLADDTQVKFGDGITSEDFADVWAKLADAFRDQPAVMGYGLMNEPWGLPDEPGTASGTVWKPISQAAVDAIRETGDRRSVVVAGDEWSGVWNWAGFNGDPWITDPADNVVYEAHFYFDADSSGTYVSSYDATEAAAIAKGWASLPARIEGELSRFTDWLEQHDQRGFVGEIGWPSGPDAAKWNALGEQVYDALNQAEIGVTYWAAGEWLWGEGGMYMLDAYRNKQLQPQSQTAVIEAPSHLSVRG